MYSGLTVGQRQDSFRRADRHGGAHLVAGMSEGVRAACLRPCYVTFKLSHLLTHC
jgi:hypothetical protein